MEDNKKPLINATSEKPSFMKDLASDAYHNIIEPKTNQIMHDMFSSFLSMLSDVGQEGLNKAFKTRGTVRSNTQSSSTNYATFYTKPASSSPTYSVSNNLGSRSSQEVQIIYVNTEADAQDLCARLQQNIANYGKVKVSDLYQMVTPKIPLTFTDAKYGWLNPNDIGYHKVYTGEHSGQYMIDLAMPIDVTNK